MIKLKLPTKITLGRKFYAIQLNPYRNWCSYINNKLKQTYSDSLQDTLSKFQPLSGTVRLSYTLVVKDYRRRDLDGMTFIVHKFFADALVTAGLIKDDNCFIVNKIDFECIGVAKDLPEPYAVWVTIYDDNDRGKHDG